MRALAVSTIVLCLGCVSAASAADQSPEDLIVSFQDGSNPDRAGTLALLEGSLSLSDRVTEDLLREALHDPDLMVAEVALQALVRRDVGTRPLLSETDIRQLSGEAADLAKVHFAARSRDSDRLGALLRSTGAAAQESAFNAWVVQDAKSAIAGLKAVAEDKDSLYRLQSLQLLVRSSYTNAPGFLQPILRDASKDEGDPAVAEYARSVLNE